MRVDERTSGRSLMPPRVLLWTLSATVLLTAIVVATGVALVALVGQSGDDSTWSRWGDIGQAFGIVNSVAAALAVAALVITSRAQSRSHRDQQAEILVRQMHVTLTRMAIDDPRLAEVWPRHTFEDPVTHSQQLYANLLLQHAWLQYRTGIATREELINNLRFFFASPKIRDFWRETANSRQNIYVTGTKEESMAAVADEIWREYEGVLACAGEKVVGEKSRPATEGLSPPPAKSPA